MLKFDFNQSLTGFEGQAIEDAGTPDKPINPPIAFTLRKALLTVCRAPVAGDDHLPVHAKFEIGVLGQAVAKGLELTAEQVDTLTKRAEKVFVSPEVVWAVENALSGSVEPVAKGKK